jgi:nickel/cobalt transporter (NicO) family protein
MLRWDRLLAALLVLAGLLLVTPPLKAQQNPILGGAPAESSADTAKSAGENPGPLHRLQGFIITTQRDINREIDRRLVAIRDGRGVGVVLAGLLVALLYGVFHALGPGHGKTVIVGYFLGRGGSIPRGVAMASWIALSHVIGAIVIVGILHFILSFSLMRPIEEMLSLRLVSYGAILIIGIAMLASTLRDRRRRGEALCHHNLHDQGGATIGECGSSACWRSPRDSCLAPEQS